jgi:hypothetical protein
MSRLLAAGDRAQAAGVGGDQGEAADPRRPRQRDLLRDHAAHRHADDVGVGPGEGVEHGDGVAAEVVHGGGAAARARGLPGAGVVEPGDAVARRQRVDLVEPQVPGHAEAHDQQHRRAVGAGGGVVDAGVGQLDEGHGIR